MTRGEQANAERAALNMFDEWNDCTGVVDTGTSYYWEMQGVIREAVDIGVRAALGIKPLRNPQFESRDLDLEVNKKA